MIEPNTPSRSFTPDIEDHLNSLGFMPRPGVIIQAVHDLMIDAYKEGYLHGVSDQTSNQVRQEKS